MTPAAHIMLVANQTALSAGLSDALQARLAQGPATFTLLVPSERAPDAQERAEHLATGLRDAGFAVRALAGDADPLRAVVEAYSPAEYDEIIVSTLPAWKSRWMKSALPQRIERQTGALVRHVEVGRTHAHHHAAV